MEQTAIHMLHHTHWDREWYQPFEAMQIRLRDALRHVVDLVERGVIDCFYLDGYFQVGLKNPDYKEHLQRFVEFHRTKKKAGLLVYTDGADHTVCSADGMDRVRSFEAGSGVKVEQVTMERLCRLLDGCPAEETIQGELRDNRKIFVLSGTWSTRTYLKRMNQIIAAKLVHELEFLCAWEQNVSRSEALRRRLWKDFLVNQAHDSICGCSVDEVHREMMSRYARIAQSIGEQTESVLERQYPFVYGEPGAKNHWLHVINSLPYPGRRLVKAAFCCRWIRTRAASPSGRASGRWR